MSKSNDLLQIISHALILEFSSYAHSNYEKKQNQRK